MKKKRCIVCSKVKGKRVCKINDNSLICPSCCAKIRNPDCGKCRYYAQAEQYSINKVKNPKLKDFIMRIDPRVDEMVNQALEMVESGNIVAGERILTDLLNKHPDIHTVQYAMGTVYALNGQYDEAIACFDKAIKIFPYFVEAWFNKGASHQKKLEVGETIRAYQKVVELGDPADDFVCNADDFVKGMEKQIHEETGLTLDGYLKSMDKFNEAFAAMQKREWGKALTDLKKVVVMNPTNTQSYGNMGICYAHLGRKQEALAAFDKALELDPNYELALLNRELVVSLEEGEKLSDTKFESVDYYKEYAFRKKSLFGRLLGRS